VSTAKSAGMARDTVYTIPSLANSNFSHGFHGFHARLHTYLHSDVSETVPHRRQRERDSGTLYTIKQLELTYVLFAGIVSVVTITCPRYCIILLLCVAQQPKRRTYVSPRSPESLPEKVE
jgi:uncharacterized membrane protein YgcG